MITITDNQSRDSGATICYSLIKTGRRAGPRNILPALMKRNIFIPSLSGAVFFVLASTLVLGVGAMFSGNGKPAFEGPGASLAAALFSGIYVGGLACLATSVFLAIPYAI